MRPKLHCILHDELPDQYQFKGVKIPCEMAEIDHRISPAWAFKMGYICDLIGLKKLCEDPENLVITHRSTNRRKSDNKFHFAIDGNGFFEVISPWGDGQKGYTRVGKFKMNDEGYLVTNQGFELDIGIGQIPSGGGISVNLEGGI